MEKKKEVILYGFEDEEILYHKTEIEAVDAYLEIQVDDDADIPASMKVHGYIREDVSDEFAKETVELAVETMNEKLMERYGYEDEIEFEEESLKAFELAATNLCKKFPSWSCEISTTTEFSPEAWIIKNRPDWLEKYKIKFESN